MKKLVMVCLVSIVSHNSHIWLKATISHKASIGHLREMNETMKRIWTHNDEFSSVSLLLLKHCLWSSQLSLIDGLLDSCWMLGSLSHLRLLSNRTIAPSIVLRSKRKKEMITGLDKNENALFGLKDLNER